MKQNVSLCYTIIGSGRLAQHLNYYFSLLNLNSSIQFLRWSRKNNLAHNTFASISDDTNRLKHTLSKATHAIVLIKDDSIEDFKLQHESDFPHLTWVHCSGSLSIPGMFSTHPLMTFSTSLYSLEDYLRIPFITEKDSLSLKEIFPFLTNPNYKISGELKAKYHSYCVASGNFTSLLWQNLLQKFNNDLALPEAAIRPYMTKIFENIISSPHSAATGPISRGDQITIDKNLDALSGQPLEKVYRSMLELARSTV